MTKISQLSSIGDSLAIGDQFLIRDIDDTGSPNKSVTISGMTRALDTGTALAPALAFASDKNTGIYSPGADTLAFVEGGVEAMRINSSGRVGIGTSSPDYQLHVTTDFAVGASGFNQQLSFTNDTIQSLLLGTGYTALKLNPLGGNVGIGTTSPSTTLDCKGNITLGSQNASAANVQPTTGSGTNIAGTHLTLRAGIPTGSGVSGQVQIFPSTSSATGGTSPAANASKGLYLRQQITSWDSNPALFMLNAVFGASASEGNRSGLVNDGAVVTIDGASNGSQSALEIVGSSNASFGTQGFIRFFGSSSKNPYVTIGASTPGTSYTSGNFFINTYNSGTEGTVATFTNTGNVGIGTTSPGNLLHVSGTGTVCQLASSNNNNLINLKGNGATNGVWLGTTSSDDFLISSGASISERARIDSSGRLLVGTSTDFDSYLNQVSSTSGSLLSLRRTNSNPGSIKLSSGASGDNVGNNNQLGYLRWYGFHTSTDYEAARISAEVDGTPGANDMPGRLVFSTTADGASSPTERMRIHSTGSVTFQSSDTAPAVNNGVGASINAASQYQGTVDDGAAMVLNRKTSDGTVLAFRQDSVQEGDISISGTTVSYNGAHLSRWSQLPGGAERVEILRGTVLSNINEMCEWGEEDNEQLNRIKVSDVEGDKNVSGVFQSWDDDDDTYTDDFYCAMTGDFIIRIAEGVTVERGDLLMSAGDGTAKPQDDDIIRSKTIAKVTSTHVTCTYEDGSYCIPCVLMAC